MSSVRVVVNSTIGEVDIELEPQPPHMDPRVERAAVITQLREALMRAAKALEPIRTPTRDAGEGPL